MPSITLKNIPQDLLKRLRRKAVEERRSLNQEVLHLLDVSLLAMEGPRALEEDVLRQVEAWRRLSGRWESDEPVARELERIYSSRTPGRPGKP